MMFLCIFSPGNGMKFLLLSLVISSSAFADRKPNAAVPQETINRLKTLYPEQTENFLIERIHNAKSTFEKWRAFPPYFYELVSRSGADLKSRQGLCAGDPHLENFGFVYMGKPFFSLNDLDDVATCPLDVDALRLYIGHKLVAPIKASEWISEYKAGLSGLNAPAPAYLDKIQNESAKKKTEMTKKYKKLLEAKACSGDFAGASKEEVAQISDFLKSEGKTLTLLCTRTKDTGGSAGNKRFVIFYPISDGHEVIELKPLANPAPVMTRAVGIPERASQYQQAVSVFLGANFQSAYYSVNIGRKIYQRRPLWGGNVGVVEADLASNDLRDVALYQARTLGKYHRITSNGAFTYSAEAWDKIASDIEKKWRQEFAE